MQPLENLGDELLFADVGKEDFETFCDMMKLYHVNEGSEEKFYYSPEVASNLINKFFNDCPYIVARNKKLLKLRIKAKFDPVPRIEVPISLRNITFQELPVAVNNYLTEPVSLVYSISNFI